MKIILASRSPRRAFFLKEMGIDFEAIQSEFEEYVDPALTMNELVEELGMGKVMDVANKYPEAIVIGGDAMVTIDGHQLGKPKDAEDARKTLKKYSNRGHEVMTSVAVVCLAKNFKRVGSDTTFVVFDELSDEFIDEYIATDTIWDKAGSYAIQHPMVAKHVKSIEGRIDTIMGCTTTLVCEYLKELGIESTPVEVSEEQLLNDPDYFELAK